MTTNRQATLVSQPPPSHSAVSRPGRGGQGAHLASLYQARGGWRWLPGRDVRAVCAAAAPERTVNQEHDQNCESGCCAPEGSPGCRTRLDRAPGNAGIGRCWGFCVNQEEWGGVKVWLLGVGRRPSSLASSLASSSAVFQRVPLSVEFDGI